MAEPGYHGLRKWLVERFGVRGGEVLYNFIGCLLALTLVLHALASLPAAQEKPKTEPQPAGLIRTLATGQGEPIRRLIFAPRL